MTRYARARDAPEIESHIEPIRVHPSADNPAHATQEELKVEEFVTGKLLELPLVGCRTDEEVAVVVRVAIQHHDRQRGAVDHQVRPIVRPARSATDEALLSLGGWLVLRCGDVVQPPGRPELIHTSLLERESAAGLSGHSWRRNPYSPQ